MLNLEDRIGNFTPQKEFDALVVDAAAPGMQCWRLECCVDCPLLDHLPRCLQVAMLKFTSTIALKIISRSS